jgi:large subunit ribosomal protein L7Ae
MVAEVTQETIKKAYEAVEIARKTGKIKKGVNEVTKSIERGVAKLVLTAEDVSPKEVVLHLEPLCKEKEIKFIVIPSKEELGAAAGLSVATTAIAIIKEGDSKDIIKAL